MPQVKGNSVATVTSCVNYLMQFNIAAQLSGLKDSQKAMELMTNLEENACQVLTDMEPGQ